MGCEINGVWASDIDETNIPGLLKKGKYSGIAEREGAYNLASTCSSRPIGLGFLLQEVTSRQ
ncbi:hypothetical protein ABE099_11430 [Paenibacillus turicensis]|uniref:hypothetical protein n=1 Tax=Paenibacillus turicensis TaxID=160487 RepID=UPI003D28906E